MTEMWCFSTDKKDLKPGMIIGVPNTGSSGAGGYWGHIGIYIGNGKVIHNSKWPKGYYNPIEISLSKWINTYGKTVKPRWGWFGGIELK